MTLKEVEMAAHDCARLYWFMHKRVAAECFPVCLGKAGATVRAKYMRGVIREYYEEDTICLPPVTFSWEVLEAKKETRKEKIKEMVLLEKSDENCKICASRKSRICAK